MFRTLLVGLVGVLDQGEGDVVEQVHRAEQGAVLEEHPDLPSDAQDLLLADADDGLPVDVHLAGLGPQQSDDHLQEHGLSRTRRTEDGRGLAPRHVEGDVLEDDVASEPLGDPLDRDDRVDSTGRLLHRWRKLALDGSRSPSLPTVSLLFVFRVTENLRFSGPQKLKPGGGPVGRPRVTTVVVAVNCAHPGSAAIGLVPPSR